MAEHNLLLIDTHLCRLCAEENENGINIFTTDENLHKLINDYLPIVIENDNKFPKNICPGCHIQLEATKMFMDLIVNGQSKLREIYLKEVKNSKIIQLQKNYLDNYTSFPLYLPEHELKLKVAGLDRPKKKRGRPAKKPIEEEKVPENKEDEIVEEEEIWLDGRKKRRVKAPARFDDLVQGKELEDILIKEGVLDGELNIDMPKCKEEVKMSDEMIIGRTEGEYGEDLGQPIFINQKKFKLRGVESKNLSFKKFKCQICSKIFLQQMNFNIHMKSHENQGLNVGIMEDKNGDIQVKEENSAALELSENIDSTNSTDSLIKNSEIKVENISDSSNCPKCNKNFPSEEALALHMAERCRRYPCEICGKVLQHPSSLLYHKETEHSDQRFVCNKCNRSFKHRQLLKRHQIVHSDARPFVCKICNSGFKTLANLLNHEPVHNAEKRFECAECHQKFAHRTSLSLHQRWHEGKKPYTCEICHKSFSQNGNLLEHKRIHSGEKPFFCEVCGKNFTTSSQLRIHSKRHTGEKPWKCEICDRSFLHSDTFKIHMRRHFNERPYACPICNKSFTERCALKKHQWIHTGDKPYKCEQCQKTFTEKSNLQKHEKKHIFLNNISSMVSKAPSNSLQLTQLIDQQGNPLSITTQDGQTIPVVTSGDDDSNLQGLMPDGTLVPIEISAMQEQDFSEDISESAILDLEESSTTDAHLLEDPMDSSAISSLNSNFQLLTNNVGEEVCLVTYAMEENGALTQELVLESALVKS